MRGPLPLPLISLQEYGRNALLGWGVDQPLYIGWCGISSVGGGVDGVGRQDGGVAPVEGVGISAGKILPIAGCRRDKVRGGRSGLPWWMVTAGGKKTIKATCCPHRSSAT